MVNSAIYALTAGVPVVIIHNRMAIRLRNGSEYFVLTTNAAAYADSPALSVSLGTPSPVGSKKETTLPELRETLIDPALPAVFALELDELRSFVLKRADKRWIWIALRQRLGRFVRKSLSFSKSDAMHELCLRLFLHDYNNSPALSYD
jgi:hypothetical protein